MLEAEKKTVPIWKPGRLVPVFQQKKAIIVTGPESSGTKMMCNVFAANGYIWAHLGKNGTDSLDFSRFEENIVLHRSVPHGGRMPDLKLITSEMERAGYQVTTIVMIRNSYFTARSQIRNNHVDSFDESFANIEDAIIYIFNQVENYRVVKYEAFVGDAGIRQLFYDEFGLVEPSIQFYNANEEYVMSSIHDDLIRKVLQRPTTPEEHACKAEIERLRAEIQSIAEKNVKGKGRGRDQDEDE